MATKTQILISARDGASAVFGKVARSSTRAQKKVFGVNNALQSTDKSMKALSGSVKGLAAGAAGVFGLGALASSLKDAVAIKVEYDKINNVLKAVTGSSSKAAQEFGFLSEEAERLGIQLRPLAQSYTRLSAAGQLLGLTTEDTREIFTSFSEALTGFGATREQSIRVFTAIEQILSKGKVSAEELRQQLGEALPGSFQLAAKAAGVTVQELDGMLKRGELLSSEFILPFAKAVRTQFGGAAVEGAKLLNAEFSRTINVLDKVKLAIVEGGDAGDSLADTLARILKDFREFIGNEDRLKSFAEAGRTLGTGLELAAKSIQTIATVISKIPSEVLIALGAIALGRGLPKLGGGAASGASKSIRGGGVTPLQGASSTGFLALQQAILSRQLTSSGSTRTGGLPFSFKDGALDLNVTTDLEKGVKQTTKGVKAVGSAFVNVLGRTNLVIGGLTTLGVVLSKFNDARKKEEFFEEKSRKIGIESASNIALVQARAAGVKDLEGTLKFLFDKLEREGAFRSQSQGGASQEEIAKEISDVEKAFAKLPETIKKIKEVVDPTRAIVEAFSTDSANIRQYASDVKTFGVERAEELQTVRQLTAALGEKDIVEKEALRIARDRVAAQKEANKAEEAEAARKKRVKESAEAVKKAATSLKDFNKETNNIQKENAARARGVSEEAIESARRQREYQEALEASGVATEQATKAALERVAAENEKAKAERQRQLTEGTRATGRATSALSSASRLKDQERANKRLVLEQIKAQKAAAAKKLQQEKKQQQEKKREELETKKNTTDMKEALTDIRDILNSYNTSFA